MSIKAADQVARREHIVDAHAQDAGKEPRVDYIALRRPAHALQAIRRPRRQIVGHHQVGQQPIVSNSGFAADARCVVQRFVARCSCRILRIRLQVPLQAGCVRRFAVDASVTQGNLVGVALEPRTPGAGAKLESRLGKATTHRELHIVPQVHRALGHLLTVARPSPPGR